MPSRSFNPLPACPNPIQWDVSGELQSMIDDPATTFEPATCTSHEIRPTTHQTKPSDMSQIFARVRSVPGLLSSAFSIDVTMLNDTGSSILTVFDTDIAALIIPPTYIGKSFVEIQLLDPQGSAVSDWILEEGIITPSVSGVTRLSGDGIRQSLYFAIAPGNRHLYVAEKRNDIIEQLPIV
ncbi:hypothetical protein ACJ73_06202 [Blastomyces percursus]|uniref:Uncharacterized protein n=1 Tax=Blastomyces percursus TaxID=1658174 RepID=A0A1J9Q1N9_9EURO|nr:hypothetical protein ACJ73_06202 [Blastomyces percursus]